MKKRSKKTKTAAKPAAEVPDLMMRDAVVEIRAAEGDAPASVRMSISSEEPVLTYIEFNDHWQRAYEILDHSEGSVDMSRAKDGLVVLDRHYGDQIGLMDVELTKKRLGGPVQFGSGERAQEISRDAESGIRRNVSVGYQVDPSSYRLEGDKDGTPVVRAMRWTPYESSFEPVPADTTVGVNRAAELNKAVEPVKETDTMTPKEIAELFARAMKYKIEIAKVEAIDMTEPAAARAALDALIVEKQEVDGEKVRVELKELKERKPDATDGPVTPVAKVPELGGDAETEQEVAKRYSVLNVLRRAAGITQDVLGNKVDVGFEAEINDECRKLGLGSQRGGEFIIPHAVLGNRDFTVSGSSSYSVATELEADQFIELLRTYMVLGNLGVTFLPGLVGNIAIPKMSAGATGYWVSESGTITESEPTLAQVTGTPHTCGVMTDISRRLLIQSTPSAEAMVRNEIVERIARTLQIAVFQGTGADGQPSAITNASGINNPSVTQGTPTYEELLGFPGAIMADSATVSGQKWVLTAEVWQKLAATFTDGTAKAEHVLDWKSKTCLGFPYEVTEDIGTNSAFFGAFATIMVGIWGAGIDLNMDTATLSSSGGLRSVGLQDVDVMVRLGQALAYNSAVTS